MWALSLVQAGAALIFASFTAPCFHRPGCKTIHARKEKRKEKHAAVGVEPSQWIEECTVELPVNLRMLCSFYEAEVFLFSSLSDMFAAIPKQ